jgi:hypothetical protein
VLTTTCASIRLTSVWGRGMFRLPPSLEVVVYYEDVKVAAGETVSGLAVAYGYKAADWVKIWNDDKNAELVKKRGIPNKLQIGDVVQIPIPWKVTNSSVSPTPGVGGVTTEFKRDGGKGSRLRLGSDGLPGQPAGCWHHSVLRGWLSRGRRSAFLLD